MMYYWGLTIDIVSCIALVLGVGLCIDYAAHVGQTFLHMPGSCQQRALLTVNSIGMAVINGGFSTLLAMSVLSLSTAYVFKAFFKVLVVTQLNTCGLGEFDNNHRKAINQLKMLVAT